MSFVSPIKAAPVAAALAALLCAPAWAQDKPGLTTTRLEITGEVKRAASLTVDELRAIASRNGGPVEAKSVSKEIPQAYAGYAGVRLVDVLGEADLRREERHALRRSYVVATASDGYKAVFSWGELFNSPLGKGVLVVYERNGVPLDEGEGRIALVSLMDERVGPRHVKWLARIEVRRVPE
jgi:DMSO/TMAO reductase YedYZ molybdopterin-dependent catalytic subunit